MRNLGFERWADTVGDGWEVRDCPSMRAAAPAVLEGAKAYAAGEMGTRLSFVAAACAAVAVGLAGCGTDKPVPQPGPRPSAQAARKTAFLRTASHRTFVLAVGWMPSGRGFAVTARRYTWRAHGYVALSASVVGRAKTRAAIERQAASGGYGSTQLNIGRRSARFVPTGLVDCATHPAVLLFGWATPAVRASLREGGAVHRLGRTTAPAALRLPPGALLYGLQTRAAELSQRGSTTESLSVPPQHRACRNSTKSVTYGFANNGAEWSGMSGSG
jgi:hypothetical protein